MVSKRRAPRGQAPPLDSGSTSSKSAQYPPVATANDEEIRALGAEMMQMLRRGIQPNVAQRPNRQLEGDPGTSGSNRISAPSARDSGGPSHSAAQSDAPGDSARRSSNSRGESELGDTSRAVYSSGEQTPKSGGEQSQLFPRNQSKPILLHELGRLLNLSDVSASQTLRPSGSQSEGTTPVSVPQTQDTPSISTRKNDQSAMPEQQGFGLGEPRIPGPVPVKKKRPNPTVTSNVHQGLPGAKKSADDRETSDLSDRERVPPKPTHALTPSHDQPQSAFDSDAQDEAGSEDDELFRQAEEELLKERREISAAKEKALGERINAEGVLQEIPCNRCLRDRLECIKADFGTRCGQCTKESKHCEIPIIPMKARPAKDAPLPPRGDQRNQFYANSILENGSEAPNPCENCLRQTRPCIKWTESARWIRCAECHRRGIQCKEPKPELVAASKEIIAKGGEASHPCTRCHDEKLKCVRVTNDPKYPHCAACTLLGYKRCPLSKLANSEAAADELSEEAKKLARRKQNEESGIRAGALIRKNGREAEEPCRVCVGRGLRCMEWPEKPGARSQTGRTRCALCTEQTTMCKPLKASEKTEEGMAKLKARFAASAHRLGHRLSRQQGGDDASAMPPGSTFKPVSSDTMALGNSQEPMAVSDVSPTSFPHKDLGPTTKPRLVQVPTLSVLNYVNHVRGEGSPPPDGSDRGPGQLLEDLKKTSAPVEESETESFEEFYDETARSTQARQPVAPVDTRRARKPAGSRMVLPRRSTQINLIESPESVTASPSAHTLPSLVQTPLPINPTAASSSSRHKMATQARAADRSQQAAPEEKHRGLPAGKRPPSTPSAMGSESRLTHDEAPSTPMEPRLEPNASDRPQKNRKGKANRTPRRKDVHRSRHEPSVATSGRQITASATASEKPSSKRRLSKESVLAGIPPAVRQRTSGKTPAPFMDDKTPAFPASAGGSHTTAHSTRATPTVADDDHDQQEPRRQVGGKRLPGTAVATDDGHHFYDQSTGSPVPHPAEAIPDEESDGEYPEGVITPSAADTELPTDNGQGFYDQSTGSPVPYPEEEMSDEEDDEEHPAGAIASGAAGIDAPASRPVGYPYRVDHPNPFCQPPVLESAENRQALKDYLRDRLAETELHARRVNAGNYLNPLMQPGHNPFHPHVVDPLGRPQISVARAIETHRRWIHGQKFDGAGYPPHGRMGDPDNPGKVVPGLCFDFPPSP